MKRSRKEDEKEKKRTRTRKGKKIYIKRTLKLTNKYKSNQLASLY